MPIPTIDDVKALLAHREHLLSQIMIGAWDRWWKTDLARDELQTHAGDRRAQLHDEFGIRIAVGG